MWLPSRHSLVPTYQHFGRTSYLRIQGRCTPQMGKMCVLKTVVRIYQTIWRHIPITISPVPCDLVSTCSNFFSLPGYGSTGPSFVSSSGFGGHSPHISTSYEVPMALNGHYGAPFKSSARGSSGRHGASTAKSSSSCEYQRFLLC
jgi:hypothetical protein